MKSGFIKVFFVLLGVITLAAACSILGIYVSPKTWTLPAFLSLSYPVILILLVIFCLSLIWINKKWFWVYGVLTLLYSMFLPRFYQINFTQKNNVENSLSVMSYNVRLFNLYDWRNNIQTRNQIFSFLTDESPDIACFQEFYHQKNSKTFPTKDTLLQFMPWKYYHEKYTHEMKNEQFFGVATFSKYPIIKKGEIPFESDDNNFCIYSDIQWENDTIRVFNAHIGSIRFKKQDYEFFGDEDKIHPKDNQGRKILSRLKIAFQKRALQIEAIESEISKSPHPIILCLDMNDSPMSYAYQTIQNYLYDAFRVSGSGTGATYIGKIPSFRIDYIFHSSNLQSTAFKTHDEELSDHRAISCKIY